MRDGTTDFAIRKCEGDDLVAVLLIHSQQGNRSEGPPTSVESSTWALMMVQAGLTVYLAEQLGRPVGTASMLLMPNLTNACAPPRSSKVWLCAPTIVAAAWQPR